MVVSINSGRDKIVSEVESLTITNSGGGVWAVGSVIMLLCRLDTGLLPASLQNLVAVME